MKRNQKGFTLMEMLIVVAIIAILVAVSIPIFTSQLEKAREATDQANVRAAIAVAVSEYLTDVYTFTGGTTLVTRYYDAAAGSLLENNTITTGYGKGTAAGDINEDNANKILWVKISDAGIVTTGWIAVGGSAPTP